MLTSVDVGMLLHVGLLVEALAAILAGVGPRVTEETALLSSSTSQ
jgi:hypothetical protein